MEQSVEIEQKPTLSILVDDEVYRRSLLIQVNTGERRRGLARTVFRGRRGKLRQP